MNLSSDVKSWFFVYLFKSESNGKLFRKWNEQWIVVSKVESGGVESRVTLKTPKESKEVTFIFDSENGNLLEFHFFNSLL